MCGKPGNQRRNNSWLLTTHCSLSDLWRHLLQLVPSRAYERPRPTGQGQWKFCWDCRFWNTTARFASAFFKLSEALVPSPWLSWDWFHAIYNFGEIFIVSSFFLSLNYVQKLTYLYMQCVYVFLCSSKKNQGPSARSCIIYSFDHPSFNITGIQVIHLTKSTNELTNRKNILA